MVLVHLSGVSNYNRMKLSPSVEGLSICAEFSKTLEYREDRYTKTNEFMK